MATQTVRLEHLSGPIAAPFDRFGAGAPGAFDDAALDEQHDAAASTAAVSPVGGVTPTSRAQASLSAGDWQQHVVQQAVALTQPHPWPSHGKRSFAGMRGSRKAG